MKPRRKLLTLQGYKLLKAEIDRGVPFKRALANLKLNVSVPTAKQLYQYASVDSPNLNPKWLDQAGPLLQECPSTWRFKGFFPLKGEWICSLQ